MDPLALNYFYYLGPLSCQFRMRKAFLASVYFCILLSKQLLLSHSWSMSLLMFAEPSAKPLATWFGINRMLISEITHCHPAVGLSEGA